MKKIASIVLSVIVLSAVTTVSAAETVSTSTRVDSKKGDATAPKTTTAGRDEAIKRIVSEGKLTQAQGDSIINTGKPVKQVTPTVSPVVTPVNPEGDRKIPSTKPMDPEMMLGKDAKKFMGNTKSATSTSKEAKKEAKKESVATKKASTHKNPNHKTVSAIKAERSIKATQ